MPARPTQALVQLEEAISPASGAVVMGTGIVSIGLSLDARQTLSLIFLVAGALSWIALVALLPRRAARDPERFHAEVRTPAALTAVAASAVLGTRLMMLGWTWAAVALLVIAFSLWFVLLSPILARLVAPTGGVSLMLTVSTESLAVLAAGLAESQHARWLLWAALALLALGLALYALVISRFDFRELVVGQGDHWITGGALAISTLAAARITLATTSLHSLTALSAPLKTVSVGLWVLTLVWLPALLLAEVRRPRLGYDVRRWATVFPVGMYAACSFPVGIAASLPVITDFARVWVWAGVAVWLIVFSAMLRRARQIA